MSCSDFAITADAPSSSSSASSSWPVVSCSTYLITADAPAYSSSSSFCFSHVPYAIFSSYNATSSGGGGYLAFPRLWPCKVFFGPYWRPPFPTLRWKWGRPPASPVELFSATLAAWSFLNSATQESRWLVFPDPSPTPPALPFELEPHLGSQFYTAWPSSVSAWAAIYLRLLATLNWCEGEERKVNNKVHFELVVYIGNIDDYGGFWSRPNPIWRLAESRG